MIRRKEQLEKLEVKLLNIATKLKEFKQKYESILEDLKTETSDKDINQSLVEDIKSIESLLANKQLNLKRLETVRLNELEQKYVEREKELSRKVEEAIKKNEHERAIKLMREREARLAKEDAFYREINRLTECVEQIQQSGSILAGELKTKLNSLNSGESGNLLVELNLLLHVVEENIRRVVGLREKLQKSLRLYIFKYTN